jgi:hypothetical protein
MVRFTLVSLMGRPAGRRVRGALRGFGWVGEDRRQLNLQGASQSDHQFFGGLPPPSLDVREMGLLDARRLGQRRDAHA